LWVAVSLALTGALIGLPLRFGGGPAAMDLIGAVLLLGIAAAVLLRRRRDEAAMTGLAAALSLAFVVPAASGVLPGLDRLWLSRSAAALVAQHPPPAGAPLVAVGYSEPSLVFLLGTDLRLLPPRAAAAELGQGGNALVSDRNEASFRQALGASGLDARPLGSISGIDYSNGQHLVLTLYAVSPG
jgi:hypothetical protein